MIKYLKQLWRRCGNCIACLEELECNDCIRERDHIHCGRCEHSTGMHRW